MNTTERKNIHKRYKLHLAASMRPDEPQHSFIRFKNGYAYAGDGHVFVRARMRHISNFEESELAILEGKSISAAAFARLVEFDIASITTQGFEVTDMFGNRIVYQFNEQQELNVPQKTLFETLTAHYRTEMDQLGLSMTWMNRAAKIIGANRLRAEIYREGLFIITDPDLDDEADVRVAVAIPSVSKRNTK